MDELIGKCLGPYRILVPMGEGGMAKVYRARQEGRIERDVAVKVLARQFSTSPEFTTRFSQEAAILASLRHPHILPIFDFGEEDGCTYLVMPFVESGTLADWMTGKPLPLPQVRQVISQVADALDYAHARGIVHRDVKPSNVLVDERGNCYLGDFGISKLIEESSRLTNTGMMLGTPEYMSPEQGRGEVLDGRSDIYSLGVVLYEMVTGRVPYKADTPLAVIYKHIQDPLPAACMVNPALPIELDAVIRRSLAKVKTERFATALEFCQALIKAIPERERDWAITQVTPSIEAPAKTVQVNYESLAPAGKPTAVLIPSPHKSSPPGWLRWVAAGLFALVSMLLAAWQIGRLRLTTPVVVTAGSATTQEAGEQPKIIPTSLISPTLRSGLIYDDFSNPTYDGAFNSTIWKETKTSPVRFYQQDGVLILEAGSEVKEGNNKLEPTLPDSWKYQQFTYMQAKLKLGNQLQAQGEGRVKIELTYFPESGYGFTVCEITKDAGQGARYYCLVRTTLSSSKDEYATGSIPIDLDTWHTARIELDQARGEFLFYLDRRQIGRYIPKDVMVLKASIIRPQIGAYLYGSEQFTGYFDDVIFGH